ncbi:unnamed protein product [Pleuronectes platessa]|uniref:Uncharacterized protein n=1 Tax=Pleuronectes platessa TaxID=8262 RepID=A0A9N7TU18_PLEPL|nr:unnamed protein product [Pleuronectes platessa]
MPVDTLPLRTSCWLCSSHQLSPCLFVPTLLFSWPRKRGAGRKEEKDEDGGNQKCGIKRQREKDTGGFKASSPVEMEEEAQPASLPSELFLHPSSPSPPSPLALLSSVLLETFNSEFLAPLEILQGRSDDRLDAATVLEDGLEDGSS